MAVRRKRTKRPRGKAKKLPNWGLLALGLAIGVVFTILIQIFVDRVATPGSGLGTLVSRMHKPEKTPAPQKSSSQTKSESPKPKFDFYTILPEVETILPQAQSTKEKKDAEPTVPEKNVSYVLQAASFAKFEDADRLKAELTLNGLATHIQRVTIEGRGEYHRVRLGPYSNLDKLDAAHQRLRKLGIQALRLKVKGQG
jgi:cell division protein FtsN